MAPPSETSFGWQDGERLILFGRGRVVEAEEVLGDGYVLLTTERAVAAAPALAERAGDVVHVDPGRVDELAAALRPRVRGELLVALGGGRVIDVAKALAAVDGPRRVAAVPTTLSGAEMTRVHRQAADAPPGTSGVRPAIADAARDAVALGALLAGWAIDATLYGLHHVVSQTLVRFAGIAHGPANAIMLPHTLGALARRFPNEIERLGGALGGGSASERAAALCALTGAARLRDLGVASWALEAYVDQAVGRPELDLTPPRAEADEIRALYAAAW